MGTQFLLTTIEAWSTDDIAAVAVTGIVMSFAWAVLRQFREKE